jgi:hypothetical protein
VFSQIAREIGKVLQANKHLNPTQRARLYRDYFFCRAIALHPWRRRNWNECRIDPESRPNLEYRTIPLRVQRNGKLPLWVKRALKEDPAQEFWMCHYVELETKAKNEIWEPLDPKIVKIFLEYRDVHRGIILGGRSDPGTLLINNAGFWGNSTLQLVDHCGLLSVQERLAAGPSKPFGDRVRFVGVISSRQFFLSEPGSR